MYLYLLYTDTLLNVDTAGPLWSVLGVLSQWVELTLPAQRVFAIIGHYIEVEHRVSLRNVCWYVCV